MISRVDTRGHAGLSPSIACARWAVAVAVVLVALPPARAQLGSVAVGGSDACAGAEAISGMGTFAFDNSLATSDGVNNSSICNYFDRTEIDHDVWYCWTAPAEPCPTGYVVETCGGTTVDTKVAVYEGCGTCPPATPLNCRDDDCGVVDEFRQTRVLWHATPGQSYLIRMGTFPGVVGGTGTFSIACAGEPANDHCEDAEAISGEGLFGFDNIAADQDGPLHAQCSAGRQPRTDHDVWYCWTAPCTGTVFAQTCGLTPVDTKVVVYRGCVCPPTESTLIGCNDDNACDVDSRQSHLAFDAEQGEQYLVRVGTFSGAAGGTGEVALSCGAPNCPSTGDCLVNRATPGCGDQSCCEEVCAVDRFCCEGQWDAMCALRASALCAGSYSTCGPGRGSCTAPSGNGTPGCETVSCCDAVCALDPFCCLSSWDDVCAAEAAGICAGSFAECNPAAGSCTGSQGNGTPGCDDIGCCNDVCGDDPWCCVVDWDEVCALREASVCQLACGTGGDCFASGIAPGCTDENCCASVCDKDPFCCFFEWDELCAANAAALCAANCPSGNVLWVDPPNDVVYAGYPLDPWVGTALGPRVFNLIAPSGADPPCFSLCETDDGGSANAIVDVVETQVAGGSGTYTLTLARPITPGAVTTLTYTDSGSTSQTGTFTAHPANVDSDGVAGGLDIMEMIDCCLNGTCTPAWGDYSCDIDGSGDAHPPDLIGLLDLLNGASPFYPWNATALPSAQGICP